MLEGKFPEQGPGAESGELSGEVPPCQQLGIKVPWKRPGNTAWACRGARKNVSWSVLGPQPILLSSLKRQTLELTEV